MTDPTSPSHLASSSPNVIDPYFRHISFDATFGHVFDVFRQRYRVFLAITFINYMVGWAVALIAAYMLGADLHIDGFSVSATVNLQTTTYYHRYNYTYTDDAYGDDQSQQWQMYVGDDADYYHDESGNLMQPTPGMQAWQVFLYYVECAIYYCFLCIAHGASVWLAAHLYLEQRPTLQDAFRQAAIHVYSLVSSLLLMGLLIVMPIFVMFLLIIVFQPSEAGVITLLVIYAALLFVWIVMLQVVFYHVYPAIMVEKLGPVEALQRSFYLTKDHRCYIFCVMFCWGLIRLLTGIVIASIRLAGYPYSWQWWLSNALDTGFAILFAALDSVFQAVLYLRNRILKEQMDRVTLAADLGSDIFSTDVDQNYIVMGSVNDEYDISHQKETGNTPPIGVMA